MRSRLLLGLLSLAACERVQPPVAPLPFDSFTSGNGGGRIAFVSSRDGNSEIYVVNADGTGLTRLTDDPAVDAYPAWSPDGSRIAFSSTRDGHYNIYVMNADGTGVTQLTTSTGSVRSQAPAWCGTKIAYMSDDYLGSFPDVYVMNDDGSGQTRLTLDNAAFDEFPSWSPTCGQIAFTKDPSGQEQVVVMNADGSGATQLTSGSRNSHPAWSPDGTRIAFTSDRESPGNNTDIYVMNADGTQPTRVTPWSDFHFDFRWYDLPAWSPDGTQIAFQRIFGVAPPGTYVINVDGSGLTRLADGIYYNRAAWTGPSAPPPPPPPPPPPIHIGDLDGSSLRDRSTWSATIEITVQDADLNPVNGAAVTGTWSVGTRSTCTTGDAGSSGTCAVVLAGLKQSVPAVTFTVTAVTLTGYAYDPAANHDVDGNSDGTAITINKR
jgi:WD40 repeat protein